MSDGGYIVLAQSGEFIELISKVADSDGMLAKGTYLTVETHAEGEEERKSILRVAHSSQQAVYSPSPLIAELQVESEDRMWAESQCKNYVKAYRVFDIGDRPDGKIDFIRPQSVARPSTLDEINTALQTAGYRGPRVLAATVFGTRNSLLRAEGSPVVVPFPEDFYWYQAQVTGATGSGKTVALKYLATEFAKTKFKCGAEEKLGCVVMINVKDQDFLKMNQPTESSDVKVLAEWKALNLEPEGVENFEVWCNGYSDEPKRRLVSAGVDGSYVVKKTLKTSSITGEMLVGLTQNLTSLQQAALPDIFRHWQEGHEEGTMDEFLSYFIDTGEVQGGEYPARTLSGKETVQILNKGSRNSISNKLGGVVQYFDVLGASAIDAKDVLKTGKITAIDLTDSIDFGSVLLNQLLAKVQESKELNGDLPPILFLIDEVHKFYGSNASKESLEIFDKICRVGRSRRIAIVFASQEPSDIPKGLDNVTNSKFYFKSPAFPSGLSELGSKSEVANLKAGYCVARVHNVPSLNCMKFPLAPAGVN